MKKEFTILSAVLLCASLAFGIVADQDNFNDNSIDATRWDVDNYFGATMTVAETGGALQITSIGNSTEDDIEAGIELNQILTGWFDLSIEFDSSGCTEESVLGVNLEDDSGDYSFSFINGTIDLGSGESRYWAVVDSNNDSLPFLYQATTTDDSGTFFVGYDDEEANGTLYFSSDGESYLYSVTGVNDWGVTGFNVSFTLADLGSSTGATGSFDDFAVVPEPAVAMLFGAGGLGLIVLRRRISRQ
jgi:hypothetical protein